MNGLLVSPPTTLAAPLPDGRLDGDAFSRPDFVPAMEEQALLRGYTGLMKWPCLPEEYYRRCEAHLDRAGPHPVAGTAAGPLEEAANASASGSRAVTG